MPPPPKRRPLPKRSTRTGKGKKGSRTKPLVVFSSRKSIGQHRRAARVATNAIARIGSKTNSPAKTLASKLANPASATSLRLTTNAAEAAFSSSVVVHSYTPVVATTTAGTYPKFDGGQFYCAQFRDPLRALIMFYPNPAHIPFRYDALFNNHGTTLDSTQDVSDIGNAPIQPAYLVGASFVLTSGGDKIVTIKPHGDYLYTAKFLKKMEGLRFIWCDISTLVEFTATNDQSGDTLRVYKASNGPVSSNIVADPIFTSHIAWFEVTEPGYYAFEYFAPAVHSGRKVSMSYMSDGNPAPAPNYDSPAGDVFAHIAAPSLFPHLASMQKVRVTAASMMISPECSRLAVNGRIHGAMFEDPASWYPSVLRPEDFTNQGGTEGYRFARKDFEVGMYAFLRPSTSDEYAWRQDVSIDPLTELIDDAAYPLDLVTTYNAFYAITTKLDGTLVAPALQFELTTFTALEWVPRNDQWFETRQNPSDHNQISDALLILRSVPTFYDNPLHLKDIARRIGSSVRQHKGLIAATLAALFPKLGPLIAAGEALL